MLLGLGGAFELLGLCELIDKTRFDLQQNYLRVVGRKAAIVQHFLVGLLVAFFLTMIFFFASPFLSLRLHDHLPSNSLGALLTVDLAGTVLLGETVADRIELKVDLLYWLYWFSITILLDCNGVYGGPIQRTSHLAFLFFYDGLRGGLR
jgi:hypothetical protein